MRNKVYRTARTTALIIAAMITVSSTGAFDSFAQKNDKPSVTEHNKRDAEEQMNSSIDLWKAGLSDYASSPGSGDTEDAAVTKALETQKAVTETEAVTTAVADTDSHRTTERTTAETTVKTTAVTTVKTTVTKAAETKKNESKNNKRSQDVPFSDSYVNESTKKKVQPIEREKRPQIDPDSFLITTYGYGHGMGLSQNGANYHATYGGWGYRDILLHYYQNTCVEKDEDWEDRIITAGGMTGSVVDVVATIVYNEMHDNMNPEAMKAQAVAAYSYILYYDGCANDLRSRPDPPEAVLDAVRQVAGEYLSYDDKPILAVFDASSGGATASCKDIYFEDIPYLRSVPEEFDEALDPYYGNTTVMSRDEFESFLKYNFSVSLPDDPSKWVKLTEGDGGYIKEVTIGGEETMKGSSFGDMLGLQSAKFKIEYFKK